jgi:glucans biosynthesis protein
MSKNMLADAKLNRREILCGGMAAAAFSIAPDLAWAITKADGLVYSKSKPFSFNMLKSRVAQMASQPYNPPPRPAPEIVSRIDYDAQSKIRFRTEKALFHDGPSQFPATFFHLGEFFLKTVRMYRVDGNAAQEIMYDPSYFDMPSDSIARKLPANAGFAGFRFQESRQDSEKPWQSNDWVAFAGASYFRAIGALRQYGLSARGLAINTADIGPEEFPDFVEFYLKPSDNDNQVHVYALLDSPSAVGAYHFLMTRDQGVTMDIEASITLRQDVNRLGLAPLTSMFWFGEYGKPRNLDWRPEVHDSDGLAIWSGSGERLWRPLNNPFQFPGRVVTSSFVENHPDGPKGFGLLQRDRTQEHFRDGVRYELRPSVWVEPRNNWGAGAVQLVEIPTDDEIHDNIVAFWVPKYPAKAGNQYNLSYRLHWQGDEPSFPSNIARTIATRIGNGGEPGKKRPIGVHKFMVEFAGGPFDNLANDTKVIANVTTSRGTLSYIFTEAVPGEKNIWRGQFDLHADGKDLVELRLFLHNEQGVALTETWAYQFCPGQ